MRAPAAPAELDAAGERLLEIVHRLLALTGLQLRGREVITDHARIRRLAHRAFEQRQRRRIFTTPHAHPGMCVEQRRIIGIGESGGEIARAIEARLVAAISDQQHRQVVGDELRTRLAAMQLVVDLDRGVEPAETLVQRRQFGGERRLTAARVQTAAAVSSRQHVRISGAELRQRQIAIRQPPLRCRARSPISKDCAAPAKSLRASSSSPYRLRAVALAGDASATRSTRASASAALPAASLLRASAASASAASGRHRERGFELAFAVGEPALSLRHETRQIRADRRLRRQHFQIFDRGARGVEILRCKISLHQRAARARVLRHAAHGFFEQRRPPAVRGRSPSASWPRSMATATSRGAVSMRRAQIFLGQRRFPVREMRTRQQSQDTGRARLIAQHRAQVGDRDIGLLLLERDVAAHQQRIDVARILFEHFTDQLARIVEAALRKADRGDAIARGQTLRFATRAR